MLGVFAEFETNLRRERQLEGIAKAKRKGVYKGRKPSIQHGRKSPAFEERGLAPLRLRSDLKLGELRSIACSRNR